jgi:SAM-dependent methyltransferase
MMALQLRGVLDGNGLYVGMDINRQAIDWCTRHLTAAHPNFRFIHADIRNARYNPTGALPAQAYRFPFDDDTFDVILLKSVFTHMQPAEVENYLHEIARLLSAEGRCLATFFLLDPAQADLAALGRNRINFQFSGDGPYRYAYEDVPERAVAYREDTIRQFASGSGLRVESTHYGTWSGRSDGLSYQDLIVLDTR